MAPGGKLIAKHIFGARDVEKDKRLNRQAARFDPPSPHRVEAMRPFHPAFAPSPARHCIDPRHDVWLSRGRLATPQQLQAAGVKFPVYALRRLRPGGGWGWVKINRPDGQPLIPSDAPRVSDLNYLDFLGHQLSRRCQHPLGQFCRHCCHDSRRAIRRPEDDGWEDISSIDASHHVWDAHGRRPSYTRREPRYPYHDEWMWNHHPQRYPHHRHRISPPLAWDRELAHSEIDSSAWLAAPGAMTHPRHHGAENRLVFGSPRALRRNTPSIDDDESLYEHNNDEEGLGAGDWDPWPSDFDYSAE